jgi:hypothetical protein
MRSTMSQWLWRRAAVLMLGTFWVLGWVAESPAQNLFDPYQPDSANYSSSSFPTLPNNLALPGQAREASDYLRGSANSRYNTFERYLEGQEGSFGGGTRGGIGVPYFETARGTNQRYQRAYAPGAAAEREFYAYEAERERLYTAAMKERDPAKRAKLLRELSRMQRPREAANRNSQPRRPEPRRSNATTSVKPTTPRSSSSEALAADALAAPTSSGTIDIKPKVAAPRMGDPGRTSPTSPTDPLSTDATRLRRLQVPERRPLLPSEIPDARTPRAPQP